VEARRRPSQRRRLAAQRGVSATHARALHVRGLDGVVRAPRDGEATVLLQLSVAQTHAAESNETQQERAEWVERGEHGATRSSRERSHDTAHRGRLLVLPRPRHAV
jgi:hypothetical protein